MFSICFEANKTMNGEVVLKLPKRKYLFQRIANK